LVHFYLLQAMAPRHLVIGVTFAAALGVAFYVGFDKHPQLEFISLYSLKGTLRQLKDKRGIYLQFPPQLESSAEERLEANYVQLRAETERHLKEDRAIDKQIGMLRKLTDEDADSGEADHVSHGRGDDISWHLADYIVAGLFFSICGCGQCFCGIFSLASLLTEASVCFNPQYFFYAPLEEEDEDALRLQIAQTVRREARLMALLPLLALVGASDTTCEGGPPGWLYVIYLPFLLRTKVVEFRILAKLKRTWSIILSLNFVLGAMDHMDSFTDGVFPVQAYKCDPEVTEHFVFAFQQSFTSALAPLMSLIHFWGLAIILLSAAILSQQLSAVGLYTVEPKDRSTQSDIACAADVPGFGALTSSYDDEDQIIFVSLSKVLLENCLQLWLQASYFGLVFHRVSDAGKIKLLISLGLGLVSASYKSMCALKKIVTSTRYPSNVLWLIQLCSLSIVGWTCAKLYFAYTCESHLWNITSGCVPVFSF